MSLKDKVANYLSSFLDKELNEEDTRPTLKTPAPKTFAPMSAERKAELATHRAASEKAFADRVAKVGDIQKATKEAGVAARSKEAETYSKEASFLKPGASDPLTGRAKLQDTNKRRNAQSVSGSGEATFGKEITTHIGKEKYSRPGQGEGDPGRNRGIITQPRINPIDPAHPVIRSKKERSSGTGRTFVKSQSVEWKPDTKQGPLTSVLPPVGKDPNIRRDVAARSTGRAANAVTRALIRATNDPAKRALLKAQRAASRNQDEV